MPACFSGSVMLSRGRTVAVHPLLQIVLELVAWVTCGFSAPGVQCGSGREDRPVPIEWQEPEAGWVCTICAEAVE